MAATQAENQQQNDVNSEKVQPEQHLNIRNTLLQNGTDKSVVRGISAGNVVVTKTKPTSSNTIIGSNSGGGNGSAPVKNPQFGSADMNQYRQQEGVVAPPPPPPSSNQPPPPPSSQQQPPPSTDQNAAAPSANQVAPADSDLDQNVDVAAANTQYGAPANVENAAAAAGDTTNAPPQQPPLPPSSSTHGPMPPGAVVSSAPGPGVAFPPYPPYGGGGRGPAPVGYGPPPPPPPVPPDQHAPPPNDNGIMQTAFGQFGPQGLIRHPGYPPNAKQQPAGSPRGPVGHGVGPPQQPVSQNSPFHHQQRFMSGQSISQPTGPTPTLNQLLQQSTNPIHRYQNNYGHDYGQPWPPVQRPPPNLGAYGPPQQSAGPMPPYRNQTNMVSNAFLYYSTWKCNITNTKAHLDHF